MRVALCIAALLIGTSAKPEGFYHQQYNYKTSSASYKNNELQHKADDEGFYSKAGDLEGRLKPKVTSNSEHSEYVNPQLRQRLNAGYYDAETDLTSHGNMLANSYGAGIGGEVSSAYQRGSQYGSDLHSEGLASSDHIVGAGAYGSGTQSSYGSSGLQTVAARLQNDLQHEIQEALRSQSHYSYQTDISELEAQLRRNLTARLQNSLQELYGTQTIRGGQSYTLSEGRLQTRPNYEQRDLENIQRQIEQNLIQQLRTSHQSSYSQKAARYESTTTYRPTTYRSIYPNLNVITSQRPFPSYPDQKNSYQSQREYSVHRDYSSVRYTPVANPLSITTIASNVQSQLDSQLNRVLEQAQRQYFTENSGYTAYSLDSILENLRQELRSNLTYILDQELRSQYGNQVQQNNYMYSVGSGGQTSGQYNYNVADLENLKRQVENNLITKLNRDFESARQRWISSRQSLQSSYGHSGHSGHSESSDLQYGSLSNSQQYDYTTARYPESGYYQPTSASIIPLISSGVKGTQYHTLSGSHQSSYGTSGSSANVVELQRQLQSELGRQLQAAINQNKAHMSRYSSGGSYGGSFEESYQRLYDDLQRNLTQQLQQFETNSGGYSQSGSVSDVQLANLRSQLQRNLASQLQSGLQQSFSASASYSASSGSSASVGAGAYSSGMGESYRRARGSDILTSYPSFGEYNSGGSFHVIGEDCQGDDHNSHRTFRSKRSYGYRSRPLGLSTHSGSGYGGGSYGGYNTGYNGQFGGYSAGGYSGGGYGQSTPFHGGQSHAVGQEIDDSDTVQQVEPVESFLGQQEIDLGQQEDDSDDTQKIETDHGFHTFELGSQNKNQINGQQQRGVGQLQNGIQYNQKPPGNYPNVNNYENVELAPQKQIGQEVDNSDTTQHVESTGFDWIESPENSRSIIKPNIGGSESLQSYSKGQSDDSSDVTQQFEKTQVPVSSQNHYTIGQEVDDSELTQQIEDDNFAEHSDSKNRPFGASPGITEIDSNHMFNFGSVAPLNRSASQNTLLGQETDDTDTAGLSSDFAAIDLGKPFISSTEKPHQSNNPYIKHLPALNNDNLEASSQYKPMNGNIDSSKTPQENTLQFSGGLDVNQQLEDNSFKNIFGLGSILQTTPKNILSSTTPHVGNQPILNYPPTIPEYKPVDPHRSYQLTPNYGNLQKISQNNFGELMLLNSREKHADNNPKQKLDDSFTSNLHLETNTPVAMGNTIPNLPDEVKVASNEIELKLTKQIKDSVKNGISHYEELGKIYQMTLLEMQINLHSMCQNLKNNYSYIINISQSINELENHLSQGLDKKLRQELHNKGFSQENLATSDVSHKPSVSYQNEQIGASTEQVSDQKYTHYTRRLSKPIHSSDFIQREINSQSVSNPNIESMHGNQQPNQLPTLNQIVETNWPLQGSSGPNFNDTYYNNKSWGSLDNYYRDYSTKKTPSDYQENLGSDNRKSFQIENSHNILELSASQTETSKGQTQHITGESDIVTGTETRKPITQESHMNLPSTGIIKDEPVHSMNPNKKNINPFDLNDFPPLSKPQKYEPRSSEATIQSQTTVSSNPISMGWQAQSLSDAEMESNRLIEQMRQTLQRGSEYINQDITRNIGATVYGTSAYNSRRSSQNVPTRNEMEVGLDHFSPEQVMVIRQIDEHFAKVIETAVKYEIESGLSYQVILENLENKLRISLTECMEGTGQISLGNYNVRECSDLIRQKFERQKIPYLNKYLEIKLIEKIKDQLRSAHKLNYNENISKYHHNTQTHGINYHFPSDHAVLSVELVNISPNQLKIINQMEEHFRKQTEEAIENQLAGTTSTYLSSYENYKALLTTLETELKSNISVCVQEISEPGLSKYSDLVDQNFDQDKTAKLEKYLQIKLIKYLRETLRPHFKFEFSGRSSQGSFSDSGSINYKSQYSSHYHNIHHGHTSSINIDEGKLSEIEPLDYHSVILSPISPPDSQVKSTKISSQNGQTPDIHNTPNSHYFDDTKKALDDTIQTTTEKQGWWSRFGSKVKQGAASLKKKIVGEA